MKTKCFFCEKEILLNTAISEQFVTEHQPACFKNCITRDCIIQDGDVSKYNLTIYFCSKDCHLDKLYISHRLLLMTSEEIFAHLLMEHEVEEEMIRSLKENTKRMRQLEILVGEIVRKKTGKSIKELEIASDLFAKNVTDNNSLQEETLETKSHRRLRELRKKKRHLAKQNKKKNTKKRKRKRNRTHA